MNNKEREFVKTVWKFYQRAGRHHLPWRKTTNPYRILVSEVMLQQTQVDRVLTKYREFLKQFPTVRALALASLRDILSVWQGLGYNRRALMLHACAKTIVSTFNGKFPRTYDELVHLPGIGSYTASAILSFAHNIPVPLIETNVRSVYLHHFFADKTDITDKELMRRITRTLDHEDPRNWYYALMDYGAYIKKTYGNPNSRSAHYAKQSTFKNSDREIRGLLLRTLLGKRATRSTLLTALSRFEDIRVDAQLQKLCSEGMVVKKGSAYTLPH